jgi:hypothetical protein
MRKAAVFLALFLAASTAIAEESIVFDRFPSALGFYADTSSVYGLTYQRWMDAFGLQGALSISTSGEALAAGAVIEGKYRVYADDYANWLSGALYLAVLGGYRYTTSETANSGILAGLGLGFEVALFQHFSLDLQFLYRANYSTSLNVDLGVGFGVTYRY